MERRPLEIGLLWHSLSSGNLGVVALTFANMAIARDVALAEGYDPRFTVIGMRDGAAIGAGEDIRNFAIDTRSMLLPGGYWSTVRRLDCGLDIGAGDSFAEIYGPKRFGFLWLPKLMAELRGVPLLLSPQTIGPFTKSIYRRLAAMTMRRAHAVVARDKVSLALAQEMAPRTPAILSADVAFELPYESQAHSRGGERLRIGVNASGLLFHEAETGRNRFGLSLNYARFIRTLIAALIARGDEVHLISHATSAGDPTDDDGRRADMLAAEFPQLGRLIPPRREPVHPRFRHADGGEILYLRTRLPDRGADACMHRRLFGGHAGRADRL